MRKHSLQGTTLIELLVVLIIIGLLSTAAVNVYIGRLTAARVAAVRTTIQQLEMAIAQYQVDVGSLPPSGSGTTVAPSSPDNTSYPAQGCGYLFLCLTRSLNGNLANPIDARWRGPYIEFPDSRIGQMNGLPADNATPLPQIQILDSWGRPYYYVRSTDYAALGGTQLPPDSPFAAAEMFYNAATYQIVSFGPDSTTPDPPNRGTDGNDISNFKNVSSSGGTGFASSGAISSGAGRRPGARSASSARGSARAPGKAAGRPLQGIPARGSNTVAKGGGGSAPTPVWNLPPPPPILDLKSARTPKPALTPPPPASNPVTDTGAQSTSDTLASPPTPLAVEKFTLRPRAQKAVSTP